MKTSELFIEQTLTGFIIVTTVAAPFLPLEILEAPLVDAKGGIDFSKAAGAIGAAYLVGVVGDRFADTLMERFNRWNRLLFAIDLKKDNEGLSPDDPFPEDRLQIEVIHAGHEAWEWMDYLRSRIRLARAMTVFMPALTLSIELAIGLRDKLDLIRTVLGLVVAAYIAAFLAGQMLEASKRQLPKTHELQSLEDCQGACDGMKPLKEPVFWLGLFLTVLGVVLIALGPDSARGTMTAAFAAGGVLAAISAWAWWRMTATFMQFLYDFRRWAKEK